MTKHRKPDKHLDDQAVSTRLATAMGGADIVPEAIRVAMRDNRKVVQVIRPGSLRTHKQEIIRIVNDADPVGFLMDVMRGVPIPRYEVDEDGEVTVHYGHPNMKQRIDAAKFLTNKYMPSVTMTKHSHVMGEVNEDGKPKAGEASQGSFSQMVIHAAQGVTIDIPGSDDDAG